MRTWHRVLWLDESKFDLCHSNGHMRVRRLHNEAFHDDCVLPKDQGGGGSVMVWRAFSFDRKLALHIMNGRLDGMRYHEDIVFGCVLPHYNAHLEHRPILMDDNAPAHRARVVSEALQQSRIPRME